MTDRMKDMDEAHDLAVRAILEMMRFLTEQGMETSDNHNVPKTVVVGIGRISTTLHMLEGVCTSYYSRKRKRDHEAKEKKAKPPHGDPRVQVDDPRVKRWAPPSPSEKMRSPLVTPVEKTNDPGPMEIRSNNPKLEAGVPLQAPEAKRFVLESATPKPPLWKNGDVFRIINGEMFRVEEGKGSPVFPPDSVEKAVDSAIGIPREFGERKAVERPPLLDSIGQIGSVGHGC